MAVPLTEKDPSGKKHPGLGAVILISDLLHLIPMSLKIGDKQQIPSLARRNLFGDIRLPPLASSSVDADGRFPHTVLPPPLVSESALKV